MDLLATIARRGWFGAGPRVDDGMSLLYTTFHIHPQDAERVNLQLQKAIHSYGGETEWTLDRHQENRFVLYPVELARMTQEVGNFDIAVEIIRKELPELERKAESDLIKLADYLYESCIER
jgi:hypothetical protein